MKTKILTAALAFIAATTFTTLQAQSNNAGTGKKNGTACVDKNHNGACDNHENGVRQGNRQRQGQNAAADNKKGGCKGNHQGRKGKGNGEGNGNGSRANFADANGNGVCDHRESAK